MAIVLDENVTCRSTSFVHAVQLSVYRGWSSTGDGGQERKRKKAAELGGKPLTAMITHSLAFS